MKQNETTPEDILVSQIGICIIGAGRAGMIHARNIERDVPGASVVALSDPVSEALEKSSSELGDVKTYSEYAEAIADPDVDAIVIASPTVFHREIAVAAADAGKHILCEKPMAMNVEECDEMIAAVKRNGVKLQIGFMRRFDANFRSAKERVDAGEIGGVVQVRSLTHGPTTPKPWMYDIAKSNGPLAEVSSHDIDTLRWFTEAEFEEVYAIAGNYRCPEARESFPDFYDNVVLVARMSNGMQGIVNGAQGVRYGYDSRCEILGEKGLVTVGDLSGNSAVTHTAAGMGAPIVRSWMNLFLDAYRAEDRHFVECVSEDREPCVTGHDGKMAVAVVNAGNASIREGRPIRLELDE